MDKSASRINFLTTLMAQRGLIIKTKTGMVAITEYGREFLKMLIDEDKLNSIDEEIKEVLVAILKLTNAELKKRRERSN